MGCSTTGNAPIEDTQYKLKIMVFGSHAEEFIQIVGKIIIQFSFAEDTCAMIVDAITETDEGTKAFNEIRSAEKRIGKFKASVDKINNSKSKEFKKLLERLNILRDKRNYMVHATYGNLFSEDGSIRTIKDGKLRNYALGEHRECSLDMDNIIRDLLQFGNPILVAYALKTIKK